MLNDYLKQIPNALTALRLALIVPFVWVLLHQQFAYAFYIFFFAGATDGLDGWLARRYGWQSRLGSFIDPLADKLLVATSFISLALLQQLPWWLVVLVFMRDFTISLGVVCWHFFIQRELKFEPTLLSKINTALQLGLVVFCLLQLAFYGFPESVRNALITMTALTTTITYVHYVWVWGRKAYVISQYPR